MTMDYDFTMNDGIHYIRSKIVIIYLDPEEWKDKKLRDYFKNEFGEEGIKVIFAPKDKTRVETLV